MRRRVLLLSVLLVVLAWTVLGCAFDPSEQVLPGTGIRGGAYELRIEFDSVLSLPAGAQVRSGGCGWVRCARWNSVTTW
ncbi:hypothetical protein [Nocardia rhamnosiphila]